MAPEFPEISYSWTAKTLERVKVACQSRIGVQLLQSMRVESYMDDVLHSLVMRMSTDVLREKVLEDTADVPFNTTVDIRVPVHLPRRSAIAGFLLAIACTFTAILVHTLLLAVAAVAVASLATWTLVEQPAPVEKTVDVRGDVTVHADYFNTFPENDVALPEDYGSPVRVMSFDPFAYSLNTTVLPREAPAA